MVVTEADVALPQTAELLAETAHALAHSGATADNLVPAFLEQVPAELAQLIRQVTRLPERISGRRLVRGLLDGFDDLGPTPAGWAQALSPRTHALDIAMVLIAASLGQAFGWSGQQNGRLVHNIIPSAGFEDMQVGASSNVPLYWHTEDAFHPHRAHLLVLACLRNPDQIGSQVASVRQAELTDQEIELLRSPSLAIVPDDSYPGRWQQESGPTLAGLRTVWSADDGLCLRYDPSYTRFLSAAEDFRAAYERLGQSLDACGEDVPIAAGDLMLIDNDVAVHGRVPFRPRYDGTDRWLKRVLVRLPRARPANEQTETGYAQQLIEVGDPMRAQR
jgi:L-asparagine oxygenase